MCKTGSRPAHRTSAEYKVAFALVLAGALGIPPEILGDLILVASAGLWSMVMIRQSRHAPNFPAVDLGTTKVGVPVVVLVAL